MRLVYMVTIIDREHAKKYSDFFFCEGVHMCLQTMGTGTANDEILSLLGLGDSEKEILFTAMPKEKADRILKLLSSELHLREPGTGVAFTVPIVSVCGSASLNYLSGELKADEKESEKVDKEIKHELIIAIANRGFVDQIMDVAREAGAGGGTVIHTISPTAEKAGQFFGINVGKEKELIMMVVDKDIRAGVMKAVSEEAGIHTKARCVMFSLPVNGVAGIN